MGFREYFDNEDNDTIDDDANFGPVVDVTPTPRRQMAMTPTSTAVLREDNKQDDTIDDDIGWDDDDVDLEEHEIISDDGKCNDG